MYFRESTTQHTQPLPYPKTPSPSKKPNALRVTLCCAESHSARRLGRRFDLMYTDDNDPHKDGLGYSSPGVMRIRLPAIVH